MSDVFSLGCVLTELAIVLFGTHKDGDAPNTYCGNSIPSVLEIVSEGTEDERKEIMKVVLSEHKDIRVFLHPLLRVVCNRFLLHSSSFIFLSFLSSSFPSRIPNFVPLAPPFLNNPPSPLPSQPLQNPHLPLPLPMQTILPTSASDASSSTERW